MVSESRTVGAARASHEFLKTFTLLRREFRTNFFPDAGHFRPHLRRNLEPDLSRVFLTFMQNGLDAGALFRRQLQLARDVADELDSPLLRTGWWKFSAPCRAVHSRPGSVNVTTIHVVHEQAAGNDTGSENNDSGQYDFPAIHRAGCCCPDKRPPTRCFRNPVKGCCRWWPVCCGRNK